MRKVTDTVCKGRRTGHSRRQSCLAGLLDRCVSPGCSVGDACRSGPLLPLLFCLLPLLGGLPGVRLLVGKGVGSGLLLLGDSFGEKGPNEESQSWSTCFLMIRLLVFCLLLGVASALPPLEGCKSPLALQSHRSDKALDLGAIMTNSSLG